MKRRIICLILILIFLPSPFSAKDKKFRFGQIRIEENALIINFEVYDLFPREVIEGLQKGMTAALEYEIQLWKQRPRWVDQMVSEKIVRMKVSYDNWEKRFLLATPKEEPRFMNIDRIRQRCSRLNDFVLAQASELDPGGQYTIIIKTTLRPMSVENYDEIRRWLAGEVKELNPKAISSARAPGKKAGNWLLGLVLNLTGFGDRILTAKSDPFFWRDGVVVQENQE